MNFIDFLADFLNFHEILCPNLIFWARWWKKRFPRAPGPKINPPGPPGSPRELSCSMVLACIRGILTISYGGWPIVFWSESDDFKTPVLEIRTPAWGRKTPISQNFSPFGHHLTFPGSKNYENPEFTIFYTSLLLCEPLLGVVIDFYLFFSRIA